MVITSNIEDELRKSGQTAAQFFNFYKKQTLTYSAMISQNKELMLEIIAAEPNRGKIKKIIKNYRKHLNLSRVGVFSKTAELLAYSYVDKTNPSFGFKKISTGVLFEKFEKPSIGFMLNGISPIKIEGEIIGYVAVSYNFNYHLSRQMRELTGTDVFFVLNQRLLFTSLGIIKNTEPFMFPDESELSLFRKNVHLVSSKDTDDKIFDLLFIGIHKSSSEGVLFQIAVGKDNTQIKYILMLTFFLIIFFSMLLIFMGFILSYKIASGIGVASRIIVHAMDKISAGDFNQKIDFNTTDELGQIATRFTQMAGKLDHSYKTLEELNQLNQELSASLDIKTLQSKLVQGVSHILECPTTLLVGKRENQFVTLAAAWITPPNLISVHLSVQGESLGESQDAITFYQKFNSPLIPESAEKTNIEKGILQKIREFLKNKQIEKIESWEHCIICPIYKREKEFFGILVALKAVPFEDNDQGLLQSIVSQYSLSLEKIQQLLLEADVKTAALVQEQLIPSKMPSVEGIEVFGKMDPARGIGGDYFDFIEDYSLNPPHLLLIIGDISGKGIPAGLLMVMVRTLLHALIGIGHSTANLVLRLNNLLLHNSGDDKFMTLILFKWNPHLEKLTFTGGGHEVMLLMRANETDPKKRVEILQSGGILVGIVPENELRKSEHFFREEELDLRMGDTVIVFTDGLTEARNFQKQEFGIEKIIDYAQEYGHLEVEQLVEGLYQEVLSFIGSAPRHDDVTLFAFRRTGITEEGRELIEQVAKSGANVIRPRTEIIYEDEMTHPKPAISKHPKETNKKRAKTLKTLEKISKLMDDDDWDTAEKNILSLIQHDPHNYFVYNKIAELYQNKDRWDEAVMYYKNALELNENSVEALIQLGNLYFLKEKFHAATKYWELAVRLDPERTLTKKNIDLIREKLMHP
jgi:serine phosphatase RsbU (regulator of sigma subunit)/Tfp pilus assembly protein PilF/HAMP domain-containing protein